MARINRAKKQISEKEYDSLFKDGLTIENVMKVNPHSRGYEKFYKKINDFIRNCHGVYSGGVVSLFENKQIGQICLQTFFNQNKPFEDQLGLLEFINYLLPITNAYSEKKLCDKYINIFEHTCSEHASYTIQLRDNFWYIINSRGLEKEVFKHVDILKVLRYVYDHFPYELKK